MLRPLRFAGVMSALSLLIAGCASQHKAIVTDELEPYECGTITRLHTYQGVFLASQPAPSDFEQAKKGGVKTVVNQRHESEITDFDERSIVTSLGMAYENPAWNGPDELSDAVFDESLRILRESERPMLMHCASGNRTGTTWLAYRVLDGGLSWDDALAEAKIVGLKSPEYEAKAKAYVDRRKAPSK